MWCGMAHCCSRPRRKGEPAACEEGPNAVATASQLVFATSLSISQPASQSESRQASKQARKERRKAGSSHCSRSSLPCFSRSWRKVCSQLSACSILHSVGRTTDLPRRTDDGRRTDIHGSSGQNRRKQMPSFIQKPFSSRGPPAAAVFGVSGLRLLPPPLLRVVVHCTVGW